MGFEFNIDTSELSAYADRVRAAGGQIDKAAVQVSLKYAKRIRDTARELVPFRTGRLHDSIRVVDAGSGGLGTDVVADAPYAGYVEFGTSRMAPQPYMRPAFRKHRAAYREELLQLQIALLGTSTAARQSFVGAVTAPGGLRPGATAARARGA